MIKHKLNNRKLAVGQMFRTTSNTTLKEWWVLFKRYIRGLIK